MIEKAEECDSELLGHLMLTARKVAQEQGATVLISNFGRALGITRRIAKTRLERVAPLQRQASQPASGRYRPQNPFCAAPCEGKVSH